MLRQDDVNELERLRQAEPSGLLKPQHVVDAAKPITHVLHKHFEWDDSEAANQHRLTQARTLIRAAYILPAAPESRPANLYGASLYVSLQPDRSEPGGGYRRLDEVMRRQDQQAQLLETCHLGLQAWMRRYWMFHDLVDAVSLASGVPPPQGPPMAPPGYHMGPTPPPQQVVPLPKKKRSRKRPPGPDINQAAAD